MTHTIQETQDHIAFQNDPAQEANRLAQVIVDWHRQALAELKHLSDIPEGTEIMRVEDEAHVSLTGNAMIAFQAGVMAGADIFGELPFKVEYASTPQEDTVKAS